MANKIKAKLALQLREAGISANKVYAAHRISKKSQKEVLDAAASLGIAYADVADLPDGEVYSLLFLDRNNHVSVFEEPDWEYVMLVTKANNQGNGASKYSAHDATQIKPW